VRGAAGRVQWQCQCLPRMCHMACGMLFAAYAHKTPGCGYSSLLIRQESMQRSDTGACAAHCSGTKQRSARPHLPPCTWRTCWRGSTARRTSPRRRHTPGWHWPRRTARCLPCCWALGRRCCCYPSARTPPFGTCSGAGAAEWLECECCGSSSVALGMAGSMAPG
jgi:hypothetical protein